MNIKNMLPFLEEEQLKELAKKIAESPDGEYKGVTMANIVVFLDEKDVDEMLISALAKGQSIKPYIYFASEGFYHTLAERFLKGEKIESIGDMLMLFEDDDIDTIARKVFENGGNFNGLSMKDVMVFADDQLIDDIFLKAVKDGDEKLAKSLAPFASEEALHEAAEDSSSDELLDSVWPFLSDKDIASIFRREMDK